jgi:hypothetical protein
MQVSENLLDDFCKEYPELHIELIEAGGISHDRYIVLDYNTENERIYHCGASSKDAGLRATSIMEDSDTEKYHPFSFKRVVVFFDFIIHIVKSLLKQGTRLL